MTEQRFIDAINEDPDDRVLQLVYADWLDEQGDPRAEAWRVLIEAGKRPDKEPSGWHWITVDGFPDEADESKLDFEDQESVNDLNIRAAQKSGHWYWVSWETFFDAMNAAAVAWVRCHRDPEFEPLGMMGVYQS